MRFIVTKDYAELSQVMMHQMLVRMYNPAPRVNIAITTGRTPIDGYKLLAEQVRDKPWFDNVHYYVFDEFWIHDPEGGPDVPICRVSLDAKYLDAAHVPDDHVHMLTYDNWETTDERLAAEGGLDTVIMGVGTNGHFTGNQPGTFSSWGEGTHAVPILESPTDTVTHVVETILHEDFHTDDMSLLPEFYITMGPATIMGARHIIFILSGEEKAGTVRRAFFEPITTDFPVSIFQLHPDVTVILDEAAASQVRDRL